MSSSIKDRIDKIEQGIVPEGYKDTKVGIIPEEWEVKKLGEVCIINQSNINSNDIKSYHYYDLSSINNGIISKPKEKISYDNLPSRAKRIFKKNDILFSTVRPNLKGFGYIDFEPLDSICSTGFAVLENKKNSNNKYIFYNLFSKNVENKINSLTVGSNYPALNINDVNNLEIPTPPLQEQEKIADILSTWDKAIENIEKLIKEKEIQKKGLMQQLLTGERRLPGFSGEWEEVKLGEVSVIETGNKDNKDNIPSGKYPFYVRSENIMRIDTYAYDGEAILIPGDGRIGEIYHYIDGKFNYHQRVYKISDFNKSMGKYVYYYFQENFYRQATKYTSKATVDSLRMEVFKDFKLNLPPLPEQKAIAEILSTADKEIELLKELLANKKEEKKGLMQLLLTGIVRV